MCFGCIFPAEKQESSKRILVLDCDDTLYRDGGVMAKQIRHNIHSYTKDKLNLEPDRTLNLYKKHGTTLMGLLKEGFISTSEDINDFLKAAHEYPNEGRDIIKPDEKLRSVLSKVTVQMFIFTASVRDHVERCMRALGVEDLMIPDARPIIDTRTCNLASKYKQESFRICESEISKFLGMEVDPKNLVFADDSLKNVQCAKDCGWGVCILMGAKTKDGGTRPKELEGVDYVIAHLSELEAMDEFQDLFE